MLSIPHMLVVFVIVLVVFGPQKLPELARSLGKMLAEFRKASADFRGAFEEEMKDLERQAREVERKKAAEAAAKAADAQPVQAATFATPAGVETPVDGTAGATVASGQEAAASGEAAGQATADAFGEPIDARATEGAAELVVTPVAESVARGATEADTVTSELSNEASIKTAPEKTEVAANTNGNGGISPEGKPPVDPVGIDVPHDRQPA